MDDGVSLATMIVCIILITIDILLYISERILTLWREKKSAQNDAEDEIISMVNEGHEQGYIEASEAEMITNIFEFGDKKAQDIMTHRSNVIAIDASLKLEDAITFMLSENNSRFPVYEGNLDHIIGVLHLKDALRIRNQKSNCKKSVGEIEGLLREAKFIPETRKIDLLFRTMQSTKLQMVIVMDEYGQTSGLIAMEDILEEIVGNLMDEYDVEEGHIEEKGKNKYIIEGITPLEELEKSFHISFHEDVFETINGFLISKMEKIPDKKERFDITIDGYNFKVLSVENKMINRVLVTRLQKENKENKDNLQQENLEKEE